MPPSITVTWGGKPGVVEGLDAADAEGPGVTWIAALEDDLKAAPMVPVGPRYGYDVFWSSRLTSTRKWPSVMQQTGSRRRALPELSTWKPWVFVGCHVYTLLVFSCSPASGGLDQRRDGGVGGDGGAPTVPAAALCRWCRRWFRRELLDLGDPVVEAALVPKPLFRAADAARGGLNWPADAAVPAHRRAGVVGGRPAPHLVRQYPQWLPEVVHMIPSPAADGNQPAVQRHRFTAAGNVSLECWLPATISPKI